MTGKNYFHGISFFVVTINLNIIIFSIKRHEAEKWGRMELYKYLICVNSHISKLVSRKQNRLQERMA